MSEGKLSSDEVPAKFIEWLLAMGCPSENVLAVDKVTEMCRGQYYMVWRSIMEKIEPKDVIKMKRLQVFCGDYQKCQKKNIFNKHDSNVVIPDEIILWNEKQQLKEKVGDVEHKLAKEKENLRQLMDKVSSKLSNRSLLRKRLLDAQRRSWLLNQVADELREKRANLQETKTIAESLCGLDEGGDIDSKLDKCMKILCPNSESAASTSIATTTDTDDEAISSLIKSRGDVLMERLHARRTALCTDLPAPQISLDNKDSITPRSILSQTASLHCSLALEAIKNRLLIKSTRERLMAAVNELSNELSGASCELLVMRCEVTSSSARVQAARSSSRELARGVNDPTLASTNLTLTSIDGHIESKRDELKRLIASVAAIERKTVNVRDCLVALFNSFHEDTVNNDRFRGRTIPQDTVSTLRQFYSERREKLNLDLSMNFDVSGSFNDAGTGNPKFTDELKLYLKKFNLEKNKQLVLDSGEKIWAFETVSSSVDRIRSKWQLDDVTTCLLCPSVSVKLNLQRVSEQIARKAALERIARNLEQSLKNDMRYRRCIDITPTTIEEQKVLEKIKKRLNENIQSLQKTNKALDIGVENLTLWSQNNMSKYISDKRTVEGKTFAEYEKAYSGCLNLY